LSGLTPPLSYKFTAINVTDMSDKTETKLDVSNAPAVVIIGANSRDGGSAADNND